MTDMETDSAPRRYTDAMQPPDLSTRSTEAGDRASLAAGRRGRATSSPPQFGHMPCSTEVAHASQNVHSNEQIRASIDSGGRSRSQHSQLGRSWSMGTRSWWRLRFYMNGSRRAQLAGSRRRR